MYPSISASRSSVVRGRPPPRRPSGLTLLRRPRALSSVRSSRFGSGSHLMPAFSIRARSLSALFSSFLRVFSASLRSFSARLRSFSRLRWSLTRRSSRARISSSRSSRFRSRIFAWRSWSNASPSRSSACSLLMPKALRRDSIFSALRLAMACVSSALFHRGNDRRSGLMGFRVGAKCEGAILREAALIGGGLTHGPGPLLR